MKQTTGNTSQSTLGMVQVALFSALIIILAFTPFLGYIPLGFTRATIIHIPVIIGSLMLGPKKGAFLGLIFGLTSFINNTINPTATSFVFTPFFELGEVHGGIGSVIICFIPRILVGVVPYYVYKGMYRLTDKQTLSLALAGLSGALTNTLLVMNLIYLFFRDAYAAANHVATEAVYSFILSIIGINGVPEAIVAAILVSLICRILFRTKYASR
ncbi:MAG: ECF transporter S component [Blautia sp.]|nr:ECF transporter S component [Blautia sp.]